MNWGHFVVTGVVFLLLLVAYGHLQYDAGRFHQRDSIENPLVSVGTAAEVEPVPMTKDEVIRQYRPKRIYVSSTDEVMSLETDEYSLYFKDGKPWMRVMK
jgi:hypothetical protein